MNAELFSWLPKGASVVNAARGGHLVDDDLLAALDSGHVSRTCSLVGRVMGSKGLGWRQVGGNLLAALDSGHVSRTCCVVWAGCCGRSAEAVEQDVADVAAARCLHAVGRSRLTFHTHGCAPALPFRSWRRRCWMCLPPNRCPRPRGCGSTHTSASSRTLAGALQLPVVCV